MEENSHKCSFVKTRKFQEVMAEGNGEIRVTLVPDQLKQDLINIAKNKGMTLSSYLKLKYREIRNSEPEAMLKPPLPY
jgi:hypothetical protein